MLLRVVVLKRLFWNVWRGLVIFFLDDLYLWVLFKDWKVLFWVFGFFLVVICLMGNFDCFLELCNEIWGGVSLKFICEVGDVFGWDKMFFELFWVWNKCIFEFVFVICGERFLFVVVLLLLCWFEVEMCIFFFIIFGVVFKSGCSIVIGVVLDFFSFLCFIFC